MWIQKFTMISTKPSVSGDTEITRASAVLSTISCKDSPNAGNDRVPSQNMLDTAAVV